MKWIRENLFAGWASSIATVLVAAILLKAVLSFVDWAFVEAVWRPDAKACRDAQGACWGFIAVKHRFILFGTYPFEQHWRPAAATLLLLALWAFSLMRRFWRPWLALVWLAGLACIGVLMWGGVFGLPYVENERWGGLILTLLLTTFGLACAFPLAVLLALARRSGMPVIQGMAVCFIELVRGVPLITVLFTASFVFPLLLPQGMRVDVLTRIALGIVLFQAAYMAEVVRGGLQALPKGQYEAAAALGLSWWRTQQKVILPQALTLVIPSFVNSLLSTFMDTSLVTVVSMHDLTGALRLALGDAQWRNFFLEGFLFIALVYFACCFALSR